MLRAKAVQPSRRDHHGKPSMTITMYAASAPVFAQYLNGLSLVLDKAEAFTEARSLDPTRMLATRLYPDMYPLGQQVRTAIDHACRGAAHLAGVEPPALGDEDSFPALKVDIVKAVTFLNGLNEAQFEGAEDREIVFKTPRGEMRFAGQPYLLNMCLPNFYFHAAAAYAILRSLGVELSKRDFMGMPAQPQVQAA
jgi:hypothetical protein